MNRALAPLLLLSLLTALLAGCGSRTDGAFTGLNATLLRLERAPDGTVQATLRFSNPNLAVYNVSKSVHRVTLDGAAAGTITLNRPFGLPHQSAVEQSGVLQPERDGALPTGRDAAAYRMDTTLTILLYAEQTRVVKTSSSGTVAVTAK